MYVTFRTESKIK